jgi:hypothetical protein
LKRSCKNKSIHQLLGLIQLLKNAKENSSNTHPRHCRYRQCPGASSSLIKSCKHKSMHQLLGLIQWLKNEKK